jgi:hypothetical protein
VLVIGLAANALVLLHYAQGIYFWADEFDLLFRRGIIPSENVGLLTPHSGHLMVIPILVYRLLVTTFGLDSYTPWAVVQIGWHLAICVTTFLVLRRVGARPGVATAAALLIAWWGIGGNAQLWAVGMNHSGSLLLGLMAVYVVAGPSSDRRSWLIGTALLVLAVGFSLTTVAVAVMAGGYAWWRRGPAFAVRLLAAPAVLLGVWFLAYGAEGLDEVNGSTTTTDPDIERIPAMVWQALTATLDNGLGLTGVGPVLVVLLAASVLMARRQPPGLVALAALGMLATLVQLTLTAYGRYSGGAAEISIAVYSYITVVLLAPALALAVSVVLDAVQRPGWVTAIVVVVLTTAYVTHALAELRTWHTNISLVSGGNEALMLGIATAADAGERPLDRNHPDALSPYLLPKFVLAPEIRDALPDGEATPQSRLTAESTFFVGVGPGDYGLPGAPGVYVFNLDDPRPRGDDCTSYQATTDDPAIAVDTGEGVEVVVTSDATAVRTTLTRDGVSGPQREWPTVAGAPTHIATSAKDATLSVSFGAGGAYTICTGDPS